MSHIAAARRVGRAAEHHPRAARRGVPKSPPLRRRRGSRAATARRPTLPPGARPSVIENARRGVAKPPPLPPPSQLSRRHSGRRCHQAHGHTPSESALRGVAKPPLSPPPKHSRVASMLAAAAARRSAERRRRARGVARRSHHITSLVYELPPRKRVVYEPRALCSVTDHFTHRRHNAQYRDEPGKLLGVTRDPRGGLWRPLDCSDGSDGAEDESPGREKQKGSYGPTWSRALCLATRQVHTNVSNGKILIVLDSRCVCVQYVPLVSYVCVCV